MSHQSHQSHRHSTEPVPLTKADPPTTAGSDSDSGSTDLGPESTREPEPTREPESKRAPDELPVDDTASPWWYRLGPVGAVLVILFGAGLALWLFLGLPGSDQDNQPQLYLGAAKVIAIGLVVGGTSMLGRLRSRARSDADSGANASYEESDSEGHGEMAGTERERETQGSPERG
ncbi:hypothetical protein [Streptomyces iconiensis]|uniref:Uncharacterized protein n=1 Tax=Streptomyces iconiensis TaxID=1384038 RepID=A0ABT7AAR7_9ACTN|nr:hypothetical protein [Streptomyces iconiensis]MDJ1138419.1 hypothetical protein [Streptomyces iconiensis]